MKPKILMTILILIITLSLIMASGLQPLYATECQIGKFSAGDMFSHWLTSVERQESGLCIMSIHFSGEGAVDFFHCKVPLDKLATIPNFPTINSTEHLDNYCVEVFSGIPGTPSYFILSPNKQVALGISPEEVKCNLQFEKLFKSSNGLPVCVKRSSVSRLVEIGWAIKN